MNEDEFLTVVEQLAEVGRDRALLATRATLQTLGERISGGEARDLAEQLPDGLAPWIGAESRAQPFGIDEFLRRVGERESVDPETAARHARAVFAALERAVGEDEFDDMVSELPKTFAPLLPKGLHVEATTSDWFLERVADRTGLTETAAEAATQAVLETLAERIAGGEVDDLISRLPPRLHPALERGRARVAGKARPMSLDEFVEAVADREGVGRGDAREHVAAVLTTLREATGEDEYFDLAAQLPEEYLNLIA